MTTKLKPVTPAPDDAATPKSTAAAAKKLEPKNGFYPPTLAVAKEASLPERRDYIWRDSRNTGVALRVYSTGRKVWILTKKVKGIGEKFVLGLFPAMDYEDAVVEANDYKTMLAPPP